MVGASAMDAIVFRAWRHRPRRPMKALITWTLSWFGHAVNTVRAWMQSTMDGLVLWTLSSLVHGYYADRPLDVLLYNTDAIIVRAWIYPACNMDYVLVEACS